MALRKLLSKRLLGNYKAASPAVTREHSPISTPTSLQPMLPPNTAKTKFHREYLTSLESSEKGFFRRFLHRRAMNLLPEFLSIPVGDKLKERLKGINITKDRFHLGEIAPPAAGDHFGISVEQARKLLMGWQVEKLKARLRKIPMSSISYDELVQICGEECGNEEQGAEFAKVLDQSGNVIILRSIVFLRPEQVAESMENIISKSIATPNDPRREQLEQMEHQKSLIDQKARAQVQGELYCGLGCLLVQILVFMRLTFWELSWDVMEPICFYVTSLQFALGYCFFLRTSIEPSFQGYSQRRFKAKQKKLMEMHNFDTEKYNELRTVFHPNFSYSFPSSEHYKPINMHEGESLKSIQH